MVNRIVIKFKDSIDATAKSHTKTKASPTKVSKGDRGFKTTKSARRRSSTLTRVKDSFKVSILLCQNLNRALNHLTTRLHGNDAPRKRTKRQSAAYLEQARKAIFKYEPLDPGEAKSEPIPPIGQAEVLELDRFGTYLSHHPDHERIEAFLLSDQPETIEPTDHHHHPTGPQTHDEAKVSAYVSRMSVHEHHGIRIHQWKKYYKTRQFEWSAMAKGDWMTIKWKQERQAVLMELPERLRDKELCKTWKKGKKGFVHPEGSEYDVLRRMGARDNRCVLNAAQLRFLRHLYV
jgi:hypothetical protein